MNDYTDDELLALVARALHDADPVPSDVIALANAAPALADLDAELARLVYDSAAELVGVRGPGTDRQLNFESAGTDVVVVLSDLDGIPALDGQLVPAQDADVELLQHTDVVRTVRADRLGRFRITGLSSGLFRLRVPAVRVLTAAFEV